MHCIAIVSPLGGSGRTTVVAHIANLLHQRGQPCVAIDLCPQNDLGMYLGQAVSALDGWATSVIQGEWWATHALENTNGVGFLPFGVLTPSGLNTLQNLISHKENKGGNGQEIPWLTKQLLGLDLKENSLVFLDTPAWPAPLAQQALDCAHLVLVTIDASPRATQNFGLISAMLSQAPAHVPRGIVLTGFDPRRESQRTVLRTLRQQWGNLLLPYVLHNDESVPLAQAQATCVNLHAPYAQSAHDLQGIAAWVGQQYSTRAETTKATKT